MKRVLSILGLSVVLAIGACGSSDSSSGAGGTGGNKGTICADGYPTLDTPCAIANEKCTSCGSGYACCDIFQCQSTGWAQLQSHGACPADAGSDAALDAQGD